MKNLLQLVVMLGMIYLTACSGKASPAIERGSGATQVTSFNTVSPAELATMLANKDFLLVNVHIPFEGDIPGTDLSIPYDEIEKNLDRLPENKDTNIVLYCRSGRMSSIAAKTLGNLGYTNLWNLAGGMVAWEAEGLPITGR